MELNVTEFDSDSNKKHVTFEYEDEDEYDENIEDIGSIDENSNFSPAPSQESLPNVGRFQTINRQKPVFNPPPPSRINAPIGASAIPSKPPAQPVKKKQISYDDILSSMSMRVGPNGKLQMYSQKLADINVQNQQEQRYLPPRNPQQTQPQPQDQQRFLPPRFSQQPEEQQEQPRQPLTRKQYQQLVAQDIYRRQQAQQRLRQIKSTKLMFPNPNVNISTTPNQGANLNRLFRLRK